jgi:hypothetical protein
VRKKDRTKTGMSLWTNYSVDIRWIEPLFVVYLGLTFPPPLLLMRSKILPASRLERGWESQIIFHDRADDEEEEEEEEQRSSRGACGKLEGEKEKRKNLGSNPTTLFEPFACTPFFLLSFCFRSCFISWLFCFQSIAVAVGSKWCTAAMGHERYTNKQTNKGTNKQTKNEEEEDEKRNRNRNRQAIGVCLILFFQVPSLSPFCYSFRSESMSKYFFFFSCCCHVMDDNLSFGFFFYFGSE